MVTALLGASFSQDAAGRCPGGEPASVSPTLPSPSRRRASAASERFETTHSFEADCRKLSDREKELFRAAVRKLNRACDAALARGDRPRWPKGLRVKDVEGAPGIWEMTWSFSGPDGRATWEWTTGTVDGNEVPVVRWRRIGGHAIFRDR